MSQTPILTLEDVMPEGGMNPILRLQAAFDNLTAFTDALLTANVEEMEAEKVFTQAKLEVYANGVEGKNAEERNAFVAAALLEPQAALDRATNTRRHFTERQMLAKGSPSD